MSTRQPKFWSACSDAEVLTETTIDDAVEMYLDGINPGEEPEILVVSGYAPMKVAASNLAADYLLESLLEQLDDEYGNPDGDSTEPTEAMRAAAQQFVDAVCAEYVPWAHEVVKKETINVRKWIQENRPDWLKQQ